MQSFKEHHRFLLKDTQFITDKVSQARIAFDLILVPRFFAKLSFHERQQDSCKQFSWILSVDACGAHTCHMNFKNFHFCRIHKDIVQAWQDVLHDVQIKKLHKGQMRFAKTHELQPFFTTARKNGFFKLTCTLSNRGAHGRLN
ncbi:hypothetical protein D3C87_1418110 [compost metagenome]